MNIEAISSEADPVISRVL